MDFESFITGKTKYTIKNWNFAPVNFKYILRCQDVGFYKGGLKRFKMPLLDS